MKATYNAVDSFCRTLAGGVKAGYAGFVDASILATMTGESAVSVSTTHGYCFNPFVFVGAGLACDVIEMLFLLLFMLLPDLLCAIVGWLHVGVRVGFSPGKERRFVLGDGGILLAVIGFATCFEKLSCGKCGDSLCIAIAKYRLFIR